MKRYLTEVDFREASDTALETAKAWAEGDDFQAYATAELIRAEGYRAKTGTNEAKLLRDLYQRLETIGRCIAMKLYPSEKNYDSLLGMMELYAKDFTALTLGLADTGTAENLAEHFKDVRRTLTDGGAHSGGADLSFFYDTKALIRLGELSYHRQAKDEE